MRHPGLRLIPVLVPALIAAAGLARADVPPPAEQPPEPPEAPADPNHARRETLFDIAFAALVAGRVDLAERAFQEAAALPGDPVRSAVAASFAERARHMRTTGGEPASVRTTPAPHTAEGPSDPARVAFVTTTTVLGLAAYGWTLPATLGIDSDQSARTFIGLYMLTTGASFAIPFIATSGDEVTPAQANLAFYGGTRGLFHGVLLMGGLTGNVSIDRRYRAWTAGLLLGSIGEMALGYWFAGDGTLTAGQAHTVGVGGDFGLGYGLATGALLGLHHDDHSEDAQARGMAWAGLLGSMAGLGGGYVLARHRDNTWGDAEVMRAAGLLGTWLGLTTADLLDFDPGDDEKKFFVSLMAGGALGLWAGDRLVRPTRFSVSRSLLVDLATVAGALGVAGIAYLVTSQPDSRSEKGFLAASALGGTVGFGLSYAALRGDATPAPAARAASGASPRAALVPMLGRRGERGLAIAGSF